MTELVKGLLKRGKRMNEPIIAYILREALTVRQFKLCIDYEAVLVLKNVDLIFRKIPLDQYLLMQEYMQNPKCLA